MNNLPFALVLTATLLFISSTSSTAVDATIAKYAPSPAASPTLSSTFGCNGKCRKRCANAGYNERCMKYCGICCGKCQGCVPSGPYAAKAECPCYRDLKNSKGKDKCP